jgi:hypothetical protein
MPLNRLASNWHNLTDETAENLWNAAVGELPEFRTTNIHLIGGAVLPVWDKLPDENVRIYRVLTSDGDLLIGRVIPESQIDATLYNLGATREKEPIRTEDLLRAVKNGGTAYLDNGWRITQRRVSNEPRIEVVGPDYRHSAMLAGKGVFTERISYQTRYFVPAERDTVRILDDVLKIAPVSRVESGREQMAAKSNSDIMNHDRDGDLYAARGREPSARLNSSDAAVSAKEKPSILAALKEGAEKSRRMFGPTAERTGDRSVPAKKPELSI